ncbi:MAG TPA: hypothetical protein VKS79_21250 [Gemmataceae bacterium]|nr:hypothetical protein [Gemmataceae bacterium]
MPLNRKQRRIRAHQERKAKRKIQAAKPALQAKRDEPKEFRITSTGGVSIQAAEGDKKLPTFSGTSYTGEAMRPDGWWNKIIIDLDGVRAPSQTQPVLRQHDHEQIVGHTTSVKVDKSGVQVEGVLSGEKQHTDKVTIPAANGFRWQMSVGANPIRTEFLEAGEETQVNGRTITGPMTISRETELGEHSFVPLGADGKTSADVHASQGKPMNPFHAALKQLMAELKAAGSKCSYTDAEIDEMTADEARAALKKSMAKKASAKEDDDGDEDDEEEEEEKKSKSAAALRIEAAKVLDDLRKQTAAEHKRQSDITAAVKRHNVVECEVEHNGAKVKVNLAAHAIEHNWTPEKAELTALRACRPAGGVGLPGGLGYSTSKPEVSEAVLEAAILHAARHQFKLEDDSFYADTAPDGRRIRRVSERLQRETQGELKTRYTDQVQQAAHTLFKDRITLHQMFDLAFRAMGSQNHLDLKSELGVRSMLAEWDHLERPGIRAEGASNMSISNVLANVLNKFALQGYLFVEQAWREIAGIRPVNDFRPTKSINLLGDVMYKQIGSSGELSNASLGDQAFANQANPYGRILTIPWTHIVNDDLSILTGSPMKIGQGAGLALNDYFWSLWAAMASATTVNGVAAPNGDDGNAFWRTTSSTTAAAKRAGTAYLANKDSGAALSATTLKSGKALFDNQIDPNGNPLGFDGTQPILLFGPTNWSTAMTLLEAEYIVAAGLASTSSFTSTPNKNIWRNFAKPVMSRYIENASYGNSTTAFWILFDPVALPVIEVAFLNGVDTPAVLQASPDYQFDKLGISIRGVMPFGVTQQNFRGGVYNAGA